MNTINTSAPSGGATSVAVASTRARQPAQSAEFAQALRSAQPQVDKRVRIERGDTLNGLVRAHSPTPMTEQQLRQRVGQVAAANGLSDPNKIVAGRQLKLPAVLFEAAERPSNSTVAPGPAVLKQTLDRAVQKGYIKAPERALVEQRIVAMGKRHGFSPDDFARVALMESDGLNPKATNGRCHGIIQFCEGVARGADSVGLRGRAHEIVQMSVPEQLKLVDRYLEDVGLARNATPTSQARSPHRVGLDDLYLSVLTPSARKEKRLDAPLNIAGEQARALYVGADRAQAITRASLTQGLQQHAKRVLSQTPLASGKPLATERQNLAARNSYVEVAVLDEVSAKLGPRQP